MAKIQGDLTQAQAQALIAKGHAVTIYPKKREVSVDGFKRYQLVK